MHMLMSFSKNYKNVTFLSTEDWLISEIGGDPSDATYFDNLVVVTVFQKQRAKEI